MTQKFFKLSLFIFSLYLATLFPLSSYAAMSSTNYQIRFDSVGVGGTDTATSASYKVRDSLEIIQGSGSSATYRLDNGYRGGIYDPVVHFNVLSQSIATQVAATAITSTSVSVTTTTGYVTGDYIVVIQDQGLSQIAAMARVTSVDGTTINVDFFQYSSSLPVIDSANDYVYEMTGSSIPLTSISPTTVTTGILGWEVAADVPTGYNVYVMENQDFQTTEGVVLDDVTDGAVTATVEEYGARSSDSSLASSTFDTADTSITTSLQQVASRSGATLKARDFLTLKAAAAANSINGDYSHTITVVFVGSY